MALEGLSYFLLVVFLSQTREVVARQTSTCWSIVTHCTIVEMVTTFMCRNCHRAVFIVLQSSSILTMGRIVLILMTGSKYTMCCKLMLRTEKIISHHKAPNDRLLSKKCITYASYQNFIKIKKNARQRYITNGKYELFLQLKLSRILLVTTLR